MDLADMGKSKGEYRYSLTIIDVLTWFLVTVALENKTVETTARAFINHVVCPWGCPVSLVMDGVTEFVNEILNQTVKRLGISKT